MCLLYYFLNFVLNYYERISASAVVQDKVQDVVGQFCALNLRLDLYRFLLFVVSLVVNLVAVP